MVQNFQTKLESSKLFEKSKHGKVLEFLAENGLRTLGEPRIGRYADKLRPEPLHCEINSWQDFLDLVYHESVVREKYNTFISVLEGPLLQATQQIGTGCCDEDRDGLQTEVGADGAGARVRTSECATEQNSIFVAAIKDATAGKQMPVTVTHPIQGVGLPSIAKLVKEHHDNSKTCHNKLQVRLIGSQAIRLAQFHCRLVDCLEVHNESKAQKLLRLAIAKIGQALRDAGSLFNRITCNNSDLELLSENLTLYYNLHALFFSSRVTLTVWTMGCALRYHALKLYNEHNIGYGIVSCQSKEAKHAGIKKDLSLSNRHKSCNTTDNKWWQVFRAEYIRCFYIPEFCPQPPSYSSHYFPRVPKHCSYEEICNCGRDVKECNKCQICSDSGVVVQCAENGELSVSVCDILLPMKCSHCTCRFSDKVSLEVHSRSVHTSNVSQLTSDPKTMGKAALVAALKKRGLDTKGGVSVLRNRLLGAIEGED